MSTLTTDWSGANCLETDPNVMQPEVATPEDQEAAKAVCDGCPLRAECAELAKGQGLGAYGVHAGKWYGDQPRRPAALLCEWCGGDKPSERSTSRFCSATHRVYAHRARRSLSA